MQFLTFVLSYYLTEVFAHSWIEQVSSIENDTLIGLPGYPRSYSIVVEHPTSVSLLTLEQFLETLKSSYRIMMKL